MKALFARFAKLRPANLLLASFLCLVLAANIANGKERYEGICRMPGGAEGWDVEAARAKHIVGSTTQNVNDCEVFITEADGYVYAHSNFQIPGMPAVSKAATRSIRNIDQITWNLIGPGTVSKPEFFRAHRSQIKYYVDQCLVRTDGSLGVDLGGAENLHVVIEDSPPPKRLLPTGSPRGPPWMFESKDFICQKLTSSASPSNLAARLQQTSFNSKSVTILNLIPENAVESAFKEAGIEKHISNLAEYSEQSIVAAFREHAGGTVIILGHTEGDSFVVQNASGTSILKLPIGRLQEMANEANCNAVYLGCSAGRNEEAPIGAKDPFNPRKAVFRLADAMKVSNCDDFITKLSGDDLGLVVDDSLFTSRTDGFTDHKAPTLEFEGYVRDGGWQNKVSEKTRKLIGGLVLGVRHLDAVASGPQTGPDSGSSNMPTWAFWVIGIALATAIIGFIKIRT